MLKKIYNASFLFFSLCLVLYLVISDQKFPEPLTRAKQSREAADSETPLRRAYFTDFNRAEVMEYYKKEFTLNIFGLFSLSPIRLNYPPEESKVLIRDQTKSTYLEELVHPLRDSIYINGFEPMVAKDAINIEGVPYKQKIIVRLVPSNKYLRTSIALLAMGTLYFILEELGRVLPSLVKKMK